HRWRDPAECSHFSLENIRQRVIDVAHDSGVPEIGEARHPVLANTAGHDSAEVRKVRRDVEAQPVETDPAAQPDTDGGDLVLDAFTTLWPAHPDPHAVSASLALNAERGQRVDHPALERPHEG